MKKRSILFFVLCSSVFSFYTEAYSYKTPSAAIGSVAALGGSYYCFKKLNEIEKKLLFGELTDPDEIASLKKKQALYKGAAYSLGALGLVGGTYSVSRFFWLLGLGLFSPREIEILEGRLESSFTFVPTFADLFDFPLYTEIGRASKDNEIPNPVEHKQDIKCVLRDNDRDREYFQSCLRLWREEADVIFQTAGNVSRCDYENSQAPHDGVSPFCWLSDEIFRFNNVRGQRLEVWAPLRCRIAGLALLENLIVRGLQEDLRRPGLPIDYVSLGSVGGFYDYIVICLLLKLGFQHIRVHLIDPFYAIEEENNKLDSVNSWKRRLENFGIAIDGEQRGDKPLVNVLSYDSLNAYHEYLAENPEHRGKIFIGRNISRFTIREQNTALWGLEHDAILSQKVDGIPLRRIEGIANTYGYNALLVQSLMAGTRALQDGVSVGLVFSGNQVYRLVNGRAIRDRRKGHWEILNFDHLTDWIGD